MPSPATTHLLYLHGFRSSPDSTKALATRRRLSQQAPELHWWCPQLPPSPRETAELLWDGIAGWPRASMAVIGSSLGGFYATWVAHRTGCKLVLLNPAVDPARDLASQVGEHPLWHDPARRFEFRAEYLEELRALQVGELPDPQRILAIVAKGDEVLDWREMTARYPGARLRLLPGSDHALSDYDRHLGPIMAFLLGD
jgi:predicted esterase YcpF (UPF0227 family)